MKNLDYYLNLPYEIIVRKLSDDDGGGYLANYKDFPSVMGDGDSEAEAIMDAKSAFVGAIEVMLECGDFIKEPSHNDDFAAMFNDEILAQTDYYAKKLDISRSDFILKGIKSYIHTLKISQI